MCILCVDEGLLALAALPLVGIAFRNLHRKFHTSTHHKCHTDGCGDVCVDHPTHDMIAPVPYTWKSISVEEVDAKFGSATTILLMFDRVLLGTIKEYPGDKLPFWPSLNASTFPTRNKFEWFLGDSGDLHARWKTKLFVWNGIYWREGMCSRKEALERANGDETSDSFLVWKMNNEPHHQLDLCEFIPKV